MNFAEQATKERVGDTVKVDVTEFAEADPDRLALHQKAVELSKKKASAMRLLSHAACKEKACLIT